MINVFALSHWSWLVLGLALLALELLVPAMFFLWLGASAMVTALVMLLLPGMGWQLQFLLFSLLSIISIIVSRKVLFRRQGKSDLPNLNRREQQYIGRICTLVEPIEGGHGKLSVDDSQWHVTGPDLGVGERVCITGVNGSVFEVIAADS